MKGIIQWLKKWQLWNQNINSIKNPFYPKRDGLNENKNWPPSPKKPAKPSIFKLLVSHQSENSILDNPGNLIPYEVGSRKRYATCSGVSWFDEQHLAVVNLYGQHVRIYKIITDNTSYFEPWQLKLVYEYTDDINFPEDISISATRKLVAITHTLSSKKGVSFFEMDPFSFYFKRLIGRVCIEYTCHGIQFSPDSKYLFFTILDPPGSVEIYLVSDFTIISVFSFKNPNPDHRPKAVCFTKDSKFIAILYSYAAGPLSNKQNNKSRICIHRYSQMTGTIDPMYVAQYIHYSETNSAFEIGTFKIQPNGDQYSLFITDQEDKIFEFVFDSQLLYIELIGSYSKDIPFPHGIDISPDGNYLAVTTLGDDSIKIFDLRLPDSAM